MRKELIILLALGVMLGGCLKGREGEPTGINASPPQDACGRFRELSAMKERTAFYIVYSLNTSSGADGEQLAWLQDGGKVRWDEFNVRNGAIGGETIASSAQGDVTCLWASDKARTIADVNCSPGRADWLERPLNSLFTMVGLPPSFAGFREILGIRTECFHVEAGVIAGDVCLSPTGLPLAIQSSPVRIQGGYDYSVVAVDIRSAPTDGDFLRPVVVDRPLVGNFSLKGIPIEQISLPPLPLADNYSSVH